MQLNLNLPEAIWILASLVALYFTVKNLSESLTDKAALYPLRNGRLIVANAAIRRDRVRLLKIAAMLIVGGFAAIQPGSSSPIIYVLVLIPALLALDSGADNIDRRRLLHNNHSTKPEGNQDVSAAGPGG